MKQIFVLLMAITCSIAASSVVPSITFAATEKTKLMLNWKPEPQFGGFYASDYKKHGLEVEVVPGGAGTPVVQMIAAGQADFGIVSADEIILSRARGGDVVAIFAAYQTNPQGILVREERGFKNIGDVLRADGTLAMQKGLPYAMYLLKKYPAPKARVVPYLGGIANFLNDKTYSQQCFVTSEPLAAAKTVKAQSFLVADEGYNPYTTVLATRADVIAKKPELVKKMVEAAREGWAAYLKDPQPANLVMGTLNKAMDSATFKESAAAQTKLIETDETKKTGLGTMTEERWKVLAQQLVDLKLVEKAPEAKSLYRNF